jgi:hypothetical protein
MVVDPTQPCMVELADFSGCAPTYGQQLAEACAVPPILMGSSFGVAAGPCGSGLLFLNYYGFGSVTCYYDGGSRTLVAGQICTDTLYYCNRSTFCQRAGRMFDVCPFESLPRLCGGGSGGAPGSGASGVGG